MTIDWSKVTAADASENLELMRNGMPTNLYELYVLPSKAKIVHDNFITRIQQEKWGFLLVVGENRSGKSVYIKNLEKIARNLGFCVAHIEVNEKQIMARGVGPYFNQQIFNSTRFPDGEVFTYKLANNAAFRDKVHQILESHRADFEFYSPAMVAAIIAATGNNENTKRKAQAWLRGDALYIVDLRELEIYDRTARSILHIPTDKLIYFIKELISLFEVPALIITVDEIERAGLLSTVKGREILFMLRDLVNILVSDESQAAQRGIIRGIFLCFGISTFYLAYGGILEVDEVELRAKADREGRPQVQIGDVPRLSMLLKHSATMVDVEIEFNDLVAICDRIIGCYQRAKGVSLSMAARDLANLIRESTGSNLAGPNIQALINLLDKPPATT